jgi:hypothetical protein
MRFVHVTDRTGRRAAAPCPVTPRRPWTGRKHQVAVPVTDRVVWPRGPALPRRRPTITAAVGLGGITVSAWVRRTPRSLRCSMSSLVLVRDEGFAFSAAVQAAGRRLQVRES